MYADYTHVSQQWALICVEALAGRQRCSPTNEGNKWSGWSDCWLHASQLDVLSPNLDIFELQYLVSVYISKVYLHLIYLLRLPLSKPLGVYVKINQKLNVCSRSQDECFPGLANTCWDSVLGFSCTTCLQQTLELSNHHVANSTLKILYNASATQGQQLCTVSDVQSGRRVDLKAEGTQVLAPGFWESWHVKRKNSFLLHLDSHLTSYLFALKRKKNSNCVAISDWFVTTQHLLH